MGFSITQSVKNVIAVQRFLTAHNAPPMVNAQLVIQNNIISKMENVSAAKA